MLAEFSAGTVPPRKMFNLSCPRTSRTGRTPNATTVLVESRVLSFANF